MSEPVWRIQVVIEKAGSSPSQHTHAKTGRWPKPATAYGMTITDIVLVFYGRIQIINCARVTKKKNWHKVSWEGRCDTPLPKDKVKLTSLNWIFINTVKESKCQGICQVVMWDLPKWMAWLTINIWHSHYQTTGSFICYNNHSLWDVETIVCRPNC